MNAREEDTILLPWPSDALTDEASNAAADLALVREALYIELVARRHSERDRMLADDLEQAGRIALWDVDPARFAISETGYLRRTILNAIKNEKYDELRAAGGRYRVDDDDDDDGVDGDEPLEENDYDGLLVRAYEQGEVFGIERTGADGWLDQALDANEAKKDRRARKRREAASRSREERERALEAEKKTEEQWEIVRAKRKARRERAAARRRELRRKAAAILAAERVLEEAGIQGGQGKRGKERKQGELGEQQKKQRAA